MRLSLSTVAVTLLLISVPAAAQTDLSGGIEIATEENRRGISWSEGRISPSADASAVLGAFDVSARFAATRGASRHADAAGVIDVQGGVTFGSGGLRLRAHATGHVFADAAAKMDYAEVGATGMYSLGPLQLDAGITYAPEQSAIGGDNLYLSAGASAGLPATPFTFSAGVGHSSGNTNDPIRAARLRPVGNYTDWRLGVEHITGPLTVGVDYVGNDIRKASATSPFADAGPSGDRLIARARLSF